VPSTMQELLHPLPNLDFFLRDPWPAYRWLRDESPVHYQPYRDDGIYLLSRYADVANVSRRPDTFSSVPGVLPRGPENDPINALLCGSIIGTDPPRHSELRALLRAYFSPRKIATLTDAMHEFVAARFAALAPGESFDVVRLLAAPLPASVIGDLLAIPAELRPIFDDAVDVVVGGDQEHRPDGGGGDVALLQLMGCFSELVAERRRQPGDDLVSAMTQATIEGSPLSDIEILKNCQTLLLAGSETTRTVISQGTKLLAEQHALFDRMRSNRELVPSFVEEVLRYITPVNMFCRTTMATVELQGTTLDVGSQVMFLFASANHDPRAFGNTADEFVIERQPNKHLAFGWGEHFCLGAQLGRAEAAVYFGDLLDCCRGVELVGAPRRTPVGSINGLDSLPVALW
jgi:cytochrome P450